MHASVNMGYQGKSGPGKIHEVILVSFKSHSITIVKLESQWKLYFHLVVQILP